MPGRDHLDGALADFSGHLAIDEAYDGPFCILSVVDNRKHDCLTFRVPENDVHAYRQRSFFQAG